MLLILPHTKLSQPLTSWKCTSPNMNDGQMGRPGFWYTSLSPGLCAHEQVALTLGISVPSFHLFLFLVNPRPRIFLPLIV